ncbi:MAG: KdsC family phosphatase [Candidatus Glassbacteria bacterium]
MKKRKNLRIKMIISDVDGVLTDGAIYIDQEGRRLRRFSVLDGVAFQMAHSVGLLTALVSSRHSPEVLSRAEELGIVEVHLGVRDKYATVDSITKKHGIKLGETCYIGDDLNDLRTLQNVGYSITVPEAPVELRSIADYVSEKSGGEGAFREAMEHILHNMGLYATACEKVAG